METLEIPTDFTMDFPCQDVVRDNSQRRSFERSVPTPCRLSPGLMLGRHLGPFDWQQGGWVLDSAVQKKKTNSILMAVNHN